MKEHHLAPTLVPLGLAGGQGKTTVALMVGRILARAGIPVLFVDADPQANLTTFLGVSPAADRPTLLEVLTKPAQRVPLYSAIHPVPGEENLFVIPANDELEEANHALAASPMSLTLLRQRLYQQGEGVPSAEQAACNFGIIIVDPPPERTHLAMTALGAGDLWVIPAEANLKGVQSLRRTQNLLKTCQPHLPHGSLLGVLPFRAQWHGNNPTRTAKEAVAAMESMVGAAMLLPHLLHSDVYMRAINEQCLPRDFGKGELEYALLQLIERCRPVLGEYGTRHFLPELEVA